MEPGSNEEIQQIIQQYKLSFPVAARQDVVGDEAYPLYQWLAHQQQNGVMDVLPRWNFTKILLGKTGLIEKVFDPLVSPLSQRVKDAVEQ